MQPRVEDVTRHLKGLTRRLRGLSIPDLPGIPIDDLRFGDDLPVATPAIYFIRRLSRKPLYVGRAGNLKARWSYRTTETIEGLAVEWGMPHHHLKRAVEMGGLTLHWWALPKEHLAAVEMLLIRIHKPAWNSHKS